MRQDRVSFVLCRITMTHWGCVRQADGWQASEMQVSESANSWKLRGCYLSSLFDVVLESEAELEIGAVEFTGEGWIVGSLDGAPRGAIKSDVA